jgi:hypothetical protein
MKQYKWGCDQHGRKDNRAVIDGVGRDKLRFCRYFVANKEKGNVNILVGRNYIKIILHAAAECCR